MGKQMAIGLMASTQAVIGNPFAEVMDAVASDICRKPVQYRWQ
jgi:hypothetical protein